jgi:hypothetical protein
MGEMTLLSLDPGQGDHHFDPDSFVKGANFMTMTQDCQGFLGNRERRISRGGFRHSHAFFAAS